MSDSLLVIGEYLFYYFIIILIIAPVAKISFSGIIHKRVVSKTSRMFEEDDIRGSGFKRYSFEAGGGARLTGYRVPCYKTHELYRSIVPIFVPKIGDFSIYAFQTRRPSDLTEIFKKGLKVLQSATFVSLSK
jgi:hypothetical protein